MAPQKTSEVRRGGRASPGVPLSSGLSARRLAVERPVGNLNIRSYSRAQQFESPVNKGREPMVKFMFMGEAATGKTAIISRYTSDVFDKTHTPTAAVDFSQTAVGVGEQRVRLALWQVAANKDGNIASNTFRGMHGAFIVSDLARPETLNGVAKFRGLIDEKLAEIGARNVPVVLLVNKSDCLGEEGVSLNKGAIDKLCKKHRLIGWFAVSAKNNQNIDLAVKEVLVHALRAGESNDFKSIATEDVRGLANEVERLKDSAPDTPASGKQQPPQQGATDYAWFGAEATPSVSQGCACIIS